jgi:hypothetical protein
MTSCFRNTQTPSVGDAGWAVTTIPLAARPAAYRGFFAQASAVGRSPMAGRHFLRGGPQ